MSKTDITDIIYQTNVFESTTRAKYHLRAKYHFAQ